MLPAMHMESTMICRGTCNKEPILSDLLDDPIIALLMARDGVRRVDVETLVDDVVVRSKTDESHVADCACGSS